MLTLATCHDAEVDNHPKKCKDDYTLVRICFWMEMCSTSVSVVDARMS